MDLGSSVSRGTFAILCLALVGCSEPASDSTDESTSTVADTSTTAGDGDATSEGTAASGESETSGATESTSAESESTGTEPCVYPEGAVEPMALDQVITAYSWPEARRADGLTTALSLVNAHCDDDAVIDWSPHDVLVFISIPAW